MESAKTRASDRECEHCPVDYAHVLRSDLILDQLGYWPCFHDAELVGVSIEYDRVAQAWIKLIPHRLVNETDNAGRFCVVDRIEIEFLFSNVRVGVASLNLFPDQLLQLSMLQNDDDQESRGVWSVRIDSAMSGGIEFGCDGIEVTAAKLLDV